MFVLTITTFLGFYLKMLNMLESWRFFYFYFYLCGESRSDAAASVLRQTTTHRYTVLFPYQHALSREAPPLKNKPRFAIGSRSIIQYRLNDFSWWWHYTLCKGLSYLPSSICSSFHLFVTFLFARIMHFYSYMILVLSSQVFIYPYNFNLVW